VNDDDLRDSDPPEIAEVDLFGSDWNFRSTTRCSGGFDLAPTQPFGEPRGRESKRERRGGAQERRGEESSQLMGCSVFSSSPGVLLYRGRGQPYPPPRQPREEQGPSARGGWGQP
jgi:hypothetical protein